MPSTHGLCSAAESIVPGQPRRDPRRGVGQRHAEHVGEREHETARVTRAGVLVPGDDAGQDRNHREHTGCEREQQPEAEEGRDRRPQAAVAQGCGDAAVLGDASAGAAAGIAGRPGAGRDRSANVLVIGA